MKKLMFSAVALFVCVIMLSSYLSHPKSPAQKLDVPAIVSGEVVNVSNNETVLNSEKILESRFLNMLNHSSVYGDDLYYIEEIVSKSIISLLDFRSKENPSFIAEHYVADYIYNMYGIENIDFSALYNEFPKLEGYVYIVPQGVSGYEHIAQSVSKNEDGTYSVTTLAKLISHDGDSHFVECNTLFVANPKSIFGYNIVSSDFITDTGSA